MDLAKLAAELRPDLQDNSQQIQTLLPPQQLDRSYNDIETKKPKILVSLEPLFRGDQNGHMILKYFVRWTAGDQR